MALQAVLIYITLTPEFVYRMELGLSEPEQDGRRFLSPQELTYAIHYAPGTIDQPLVLRKSIPWTSIQKKSEAPIRKTMMTSRPAWLGIAKLLMR